MDGIQPAIVAPELPVLDISTLSTFKFERVLSESKPSSPVASANLYKKLMIRHSDRLYLRPRYTS
jgi:hypothetical protein